VANLFDTTFTGDNIVTFSGGATPVAFVIMHVTTLGPGVGRVDSTLDRITRAGYWTVGFHHGTLGVDVWLPPQYIEFIGQFWELGFPFSTDSWEFWRVHLSTGTEARFRVNSP
jgi:hypothetical protein